MKAIAAQEEPKLMSRNERERERKRAKYEHRVAVSRVAAA